MTLIKRKYNNHSFGKQAEMSVMNFYLNKGFLILERNYRYGRAEVDIIMKNNDLIVFIEVKARRSGGFGTPENFMSKAQQNRVLKVADHYVHLHNWVLKIRFDIVAVSIITNGNYVIEQFEDAFF